MAETTVILGFHKGAHILQACLKSLLSTTGENVEILVIVNGPTSTRFASAGWPSRFRFLQIDKAVGNAKALNIGVAEAKTQFVVLADYDLVFTPHWLQALQRAMMESEVHAAASMLVDPQTDRVSEFGIGYTEYNGAHPFKDRPCDHPMVSRRHFPQAACSAGTLIRRDTFIQLGGFDEDLGTMYADVDFFLRLKRAGMSIVAEPTSRLYHLGGWDSQRSREYKDILLKGDHKGAFVWKNRDVLEVDLDRYFQRSFQLNALSPANRYVICGAMNVANCHWYFQQFELAGGRNYDIHVNPSKHRDASRENLFELFGYEVMSLRLPIAYFVDRFVAVRDNYYWWSQRNSELDLVIDRNANVLTAKEALGEPRCQA